MTRVFYTSADSAESSERLTGLLHLSLGRAGQVHLRPPGLRAPRALPRGESGGVAAHAEPRIGARRGGLRRAERKYVHPVRQCRLEVDLRTRYLHHLQSV